MKYTYNNDTYDNEHTSDCAFRAAGATVKAVESVMNSDVSAAFANIRPPGHHADSNSTAGFCFINNVAVAAAHARQNLGARKVLIFDWDVHHGNGTQDIFQDDPNVMFLSFHRFDDGHFYPVISI